MPLLHRRLLLLRVLVMHLRLRDIMLRLRGITALRLLPRQDNMLVQNMTEARAGTIVLRLAVRMLVTGPRKVMIGTIIAAPDVKEVITKTIKIELRAAKKRSGRFGGSDLLGLF